MSSSEIRKLLGQCFFIGFEGLELPTTIEKFISENSIGGVTLFANNYESPAQLAELINHIQSLSPSLPLFVSVDHEGGRVHRFKKPFTKFPEAQVIGNLESPKLVYEYAEVMAKELKAVGFNMVYAPVADINTNPKNPVIGARSFGDSEEHVSKMVSAVVRGYITNKISPVVKHFPGHGDTTQDSHFHLPKIKTPLATILDREVKPFVKAFKSRCEFVMTAHIIVEEVEAKLPATLSKKILQDILRNQLRYKGIIISDDMEMKAIADHFGEIDAPLQAIEAGVDILLYHTEPVSTRVFDGLLSKLTSPEGRNALEMLKASSERVIAAKKKLLLPYAPVQIPEIQSVVGCSEHLAVLKKIEQVSKLSDIA